MNLNTEARQGGHWQQLEEILSLQIMRLSIKGSLWAVTVPQLCLLFQQLREKPQENEWGRLSTARSWNWGAQGMASPLTTLSHYS